MASMWSPASASATSISSKTTRSMSSSFPRPHPGRREVVQRVHSPRAGLQPLQHGLKPPLGIPGLLQRFRHGVPGDPLPPPVGAEQEGVAGLHLHQLRLGDPQRTGLTQRLQEPVPVGVAPNLVVPDVPRPDPEFRDAVGPGPLEHRPFLKW